MFSKKSIISVVCIGIIAIQLPVFADDISDMKASVNDMITKLIQKYETRIQELETENAALKQKVASLQGTSTPVVKETPAPVVTIPTSPIITSSTSKTDIYNAIIKRVNESLGTILSENHLPGYTAIGLFEFAEPNAFFISLDDGQNPAGVTAFKTKILYTFNNNLTLTKIGVFDLDYGLQRYRTVFGSNPYINSLRVRMLNPNYKGKLLTPVVSNDGASTSVSSSTTTAPIISSGVNTTSDVTLAQIKSAYDKTKLLDALKLSEVYIVKNPNDVEVLRIRYRSYYIIGKYTESLTEVKKIETLQGSSFERTIACDASVIAKIAKKTDVSTYYGTICKQQ